MTTQQTIEITAEIVEISNFVVTNHYTYPNSRLADGKATINENEIRFCIRRDAQNEPFVSWADHPVFELLKGMLVVDTSSILATYKTEYAKWLEETKRNKRREAITRWESEPARYWVRRFKDDGWKIKPTQEEYIEKDMHRLSAYNTKTNKDLIVTYYVHQHTDGRGTSWVLTCDKGNYKPIKRSKHTDKIIDAMEVDWNRKCSIRKSETETADRRQQRLQEIQQDIPTAKRALIYRSSGRTSHYTCEGFQVPLDDTKYPATMEWTETNGNCRIEISKCTQAQAIAIAKILTAK